MYINVNGDNKTIKGGKTDKIERGRINTYQSKDISKGEGERAQRKVSEGMYPKHRKNPSPNAT